MNGFLSPEGMFYECNYGGHGELAREILNSNEDKLKIKNWIYFGYTGDLGSNTSSYVFMNLSNDGVFYKKQIEWFKSNKGILTQGQIDDFELNLELFPELKED